jgi:hypothetical protein
MPSIQKRVAKTIKESLEENPHDIEGAAHAAIGTMLNWLRDPSDEVLQAGLEAIHDHNERKLRWIWSVMLNEISKEAGF